MKLLWSPRSPFARKVCIVIEEAGLSDQVERVPALAIFAARPNPVVLAANPLGKIPALILDDGTHLYDSTVICEYLITLAKPDLCPADQRITHLRWQALADGLLDILLLWRTERARAAKADPVILSAFEVKTRTALAQLEVEAEMLDATPFGLGHTAVICALGHLDFRFAGCGWQAALPRLAAFYAEMCARPSVQATTVIDDGAGPPGGPDETPAFVYRSQS